MFEKIYEFKRDFTTLKKDLDIKYIWKTVKNPQANALVERVNQLIYNMIVIKGIYK